MSTQQLGTSSLNGDGSLMLHCAPIVASIGRRPIARAERGIRKLRMNEPFAFGEYRLLTRNHVTCDVFGDICRCRTDMRILSYLSHPLQCCANQPFSPWLVVLCP